MKCKSDISVGTLHIVSGLGVSTIRWISYVQHIVLLRDQWPATTLKIQSEVQEGSQVRVKIS